MKETVPLIPIRDRIRDLNTKGYYLLVALSFIYRASVRSPLLKLAFTLTALATVVPVQDYIESAPWLERIRLSKVIGLILALACTLWWMWKESGTQL